MDKANKLLNKYSQAFSNCLDVKDNPFQTKEGQLKTFKEIGWNLKEYLGEKEYKHFLQSIYNIYVKSSMLKPILNAKEVIDAINYYNKI